MSEPVLGWAPIDEDALLDPARRSIGEVLREVAAVYRRDAGPILILIGRIVLAPLVPILCAILYRDFRSAGPRTPARPTDDPAAPPGWGSTG